MNIISICDGMSCGQIALRDLGIRYNKYYASEIDKHAIRQTQLNFPDTIQLGDIEGWKSWDIDWGSINLILAGTPCTGFSLAGRMLNFDDPQSRLFFVFVEILNHVKKHNPDIFFLFENVMMKKWCLRVISEKLGVFPVLINSALVSAQNRKRYYWTNIRTRKEGLFRELHTDIPQPADRGILIRDILEDEVNEKYFLNRKRSKMLIEKLQAKINPRKSYCLTGGIQARRRNTVLIEMSCDSHSILQRGHGFNKGELKKRKSPALTVKDWPNSNYLATGNIIRRLTPVECARLQTIPEWYKWDCSDTQAYKMLGNGWTIEVIKHILSYAIFN